MVATSHGEGRFIGVGGSWKRERERITVTPELSSKNIAFHLEISDVG